jgi:hypothetical protein
VVLKFKVRQVVMVAKERWDGMESQGELRFLIVGFQNKLDPPGKRQ